MQGSYGRDFDLNLLRVFAVVADAGSVTEAAKRLYLTQPAVSAALARLTNALETPLFVRKGRGLVLSARGQLLRKDIGPHLGALVDAALAPSVFDPKTSTRTFRIGLSDTAEVWLLPSLLHVLGEQAPKMRIVVTRVQFRTVEAELGRGLDAAVTVADELPASFQRTSLLVGSFVCLYDPRHAKFRRLDSATYFAHHHVVVSYNGDLRGIVEDMVPTQRDVRCSVDSFANLGAIVEGGALLATVPTTVARQIMDVRPHLRTAALPFKLGSGSTDLIWDVTTADDEACRFMRERIQQIARVTSRRQQQARSPTRH
jgi:LysR family transcriptional regulator, mexEF-oprN operon transcriptional activator